jgi:ArsR family transcriptional regulator
MKVRREEESREVKLTALQAQLCKTLSHVKRLQIVYALESGEKFVGELAEELALPYANLSQHLHALQQAGLIEVRHEGKRSYYRLSTQQIAQACALVRGVLRERLEKLGQLVQANGTGRRASDRGGE